MLAKIGLLTKPKHLSGTVSSGYFLVDKINNGRGIGGIEALPLPIFPEPGHLAFCISSGVPLNEFKCFREGFFSIQKVEEFLVAHRLEGV